MPTNPVADAPNLATGTLTGRFLAYAATKAGQGPRGFTAPTFTVSVSRTETISFAEDGPDAPFTLIVEPVEYRLDADGYLVDTDGKTRGATVPVGQYLITQKLHGETLRNETGPISYPVIVAADRTVDLTEQTPFVEPPAPAFRVSAQVYNDILTAATNVARDAADARAAAELKVPGPRGYKGDAGLSAYAVATSLGFVGTTSDWLASLVGRAGDKGLNGIDGTNGINGLSAYELAILNGYQGSPIDWLTSLHGSKGDRGDAGQSAYEVAQAAGFAGTRAQWLASLVGPKGEDGTGGGTGTGGTADLSQSFRGTWTDPTKVTVSQITWDNGLPAGSSTIGADFLTFPDAADTPYGAGSGTTRVLRVKTPPSGTTRATVPITMSAGGGTASIRYSVQSEGSYDFLLIVLDGTVVKTVSGQGGWADYALSVPEGTHQLGFGYTKDGSVDIGADAAFFGLIDLQNGAVGGSVPTAPVSYNRGDLVTWHATLYVARVVHPTTEPGLDPGEWVRLLQGIDPSNALVGLPSGGSTGQALLKNSASNGDASWQSLKTRREGRTLPGAGFNLSPGQRYGYTLTETNPLAPMFPSVPVAIKRILYAVSGASAGVRVRLYKASYVADIDRDRPRTTPVPMVDGPIFDVILPNTGGSLYGMDFTSCPVGTMGENPYLLIENLDQSNPIYPTISGIEYVQLEDR